MALTSNATTDTTSQVKLNTYEPSHTSFESDEAFFHSQEGNHILFEGLKPLRFWLGRHSELSITGMSSSMVR